MTEEKVLCLKRENLEKAGMFQGLSFEVDRYLPLIDNPENRFFIRRSEAEENPKFKQWIPYVLIFKDDKILRYQRGQGGGENRLHGRLSIGFGGHVNEQDYAQENGCMAGLLREIREETGFQPAKTNAVAVINDDSTEVGRVHVGIVYIMRLPDHAKIIRRSEISSPKFISLPEACQNFARYESWSQLCISRIIGASKA